jgi:hypothetical protein
MGALDLRLLSDGTIVVYHRASNVERRFSPIEFERLVTFLLEYYREGRTYLSPVVKVFPSNADEFHKPPKATDDEAVLALWPYRKELYEFVEANKLFIIRYLTLDFVEEVFKKNPEPWRQIGITQFNYVCQIREIVKQAINAVDAKRFSEALQLYEKAKAVFREQGEVFTNTFCKKLQEYCDSLGLYDPDIKCRFCPHRRHLEVDERKQFLKPVKTKGELRELLQGLHDQLGREIERYYRLHREGGTPDGKKKFLES